ncbi:enoyl-CoA hydratase-related protein [Blastococcus mobilis]|uniref:Enoyl-CoA hydratase/carnithine racemase n=1 Tax=Blastococcus mobilis TaxID=1938746 RepID=A0A238ZDV1_9ACTN|nr:enoyl-CoA hydratase-related protein [Blastococcus mobilis]SNR80943.1 Enoyl-CoA hydratase/carnithine racemase [Blastococcus mobilis]
MTPTDPARTLRVEHRHGGVLVMTMQRPERRNAVDQPLADAIDAAMHRLEHEDGLRVGVLTGDGGYFSAGTDLTLEASPTTPDGGEYGFVRRSRTRPLIAAVEGFALGGGMEMVLACDLVVAAEDAVLGLPETLRGVVANCGALFRAPERLGPQVAMELLLTGSRLAAPRAHALGLVNRLAPPGAALDTALELATEVCGASPDAVAATLRAAFASRTRREADEWELTERAAAEAAASPDRAEGIAAFFAKRTPRWAHPGT